MQGRALRTEQLRFGRYRAVQPAQPADKQPLGCPESKGVAAMTQEQEQPRTGAEPANAEEPATGPGPAESPSTEGTDEASPSAPASPDASPESSEG